MFTDFKKGLSNVLEKGLDAYGVYNDYKIQDLQTRREQELQDATLNKAIAEEERLKAQQNVEAMKSQNMVQIALYAVFGVGLAGLAWVLKEMFD